MSRAVQVPVEIRWLTNAELSSVVSIENQSFLQPWTHVDFVNCLSRNNVVGLIAMMDRRVVAFCIYEVLGKRIQLLNLCVLEKYRKMGIGSALVRAVLAKLKKNAQERCVAEIREHNTICQYFLKALGFVVSDTMKKYYDEDSKDPEDCYIFERWTVLD